MIDYTMFEVRRSNNAVGLYLFGTDRPLVGKYQDSDLPGQPQLRYSLRLPFGRARVSPVLLHNQTTNESTNDCDGWIVAEQRANKPASFKGTIDFSRANLPLSPQHKLRLSWRPFVSSPIVAHFVVVRSKVEKWEIVEVEGLEALYDAVRYEAFLQTPWMGKHSGSGIEGV